MTRHPTASCWFVLGILILARASAPAASWQAALVEQTDPAKLATLGPRGANPRVNRIVFHLHQAQTSGVPTAEALDRAFAQNGTTGLVATLSKETLLLNFSHAENWGLLTRDNLEKLRRGDAAIITRGWHRGQAIDIDHIVPISLAPEAGNSLANLELLPASVNRSKGADVGLHELRFAGRLHEAGILSGGSLWRVRWAYFRGKLLLGLGALAALAGYWRVRRARRRRAGLGPDAVVSRTLRRLLRRRF